MKVRETAAVPRRRRRITGPVAGCLATIAFLYLVAVFNVVVPWLSYSTAGAFNLLLLTASTGLGTGCYLLCVLCDPGAVPPGWAPDPEDGAVVQVKRSGGGARFCAKCSAHKPPRAHHCRRCGRCVLRMDHHCVWTGSCVGQGNYRAFLLMVTWLAAASLHALGLLLAYDAHLLSLGLGWGDGGGRLEWGPGLFWLRAAAQLAGTALALPVAAGLAVLALWNGFLLAQNKTTIEYHEGVAARTAAGAKGGGGSGGGAGGGVGQHPYDLGWHANLTAVCGEEVACWALPAGGPAAAGDGLRFATPYDGGGGASLQSPTSSA